MSENLIDKMKKTMHSRQITFRKVLWYIFFGLIAVVFVFFGANNQNMGSPGHAAIVNNSIVTLAELEREQRRVEAMYRQFLGPNMDFSSQRQMLVQEAIQSLVNQRLVSQAAQKAGFHVSDQEVINFIIKDYPAFQVNGVFQRALYYDTLKENRISPVEFESFIRASIEGQRSRMAFETASLPNVLEKEKQKALKETQVVLNYVKISPRELESTLKVTISEIESALAQPAFLKRAEDEFKATKNKFDQPEQARAQHILIKSEAGDVESDKKALEKIQKIKLDLKSNDFGSLAEKHSEDPGSKSKKGDLGYFGKGQMVPEFEAKVFSMKPGEVSEPVKTQFGYHLIKLTEIKPGMSAQFADHKNTVAQTLLARDQVTKLRAQAQDVFSKGEEKSWLSALGLSWKDTPPFDLSADNVPELSPKVLEVMDKVLKPGAPPQIVQDSDITYIVKLKETKKSPAPAASSFDMESQARARELFSSWLDQYR
ncbi:MAG: SurA N-terminal domain-containing protein, partial [Bdellovibrionales bacterium]